MKSNPCYRKFLSALFFVGLALPLMAQEPADTTSYDELDEIVVTATRPVITSTAEKTTYDVAADPEAKALTLLDLLRKVPGITVDAQDNVTLNGSGNFSIEIDGRSNPAFSQNPGQIFKSIPASVVQRVEVVSSPGARYDAEGVGGVLNIVMKGTGENMDGYSLTISADAGNRNQGGSIFGMMQKGRLGMTLNLSGGRGEMADFDIDMLREQADGFGLLYSGYMKNKFAYGRAQLDASVKISEADRLVLSGSWNIYDWSNRFIAGSSSFMNGSALSAYQMNSLSKGLNHAISAGADYTHIFRGNARNKLRVAYQFDSQPNRGTSESVYSPSADMQSPLPENYSSENRNNMPQHMALAEYSLPLGDMHLLEMGGKMTWRNSISTAENLDYRHRTAIAAGFASYSLTAGNFSTKAGLRYEHTAQRARFRHGAGEDFSADYSNLVPSLTAGWNFSPVSALTAAYSMRISRPGINYLNPYVDDLNPLEVRQGNPYLRPERYNSVALSYNGMHGTFMVNTRLDYTFCNDGLTELTSMRDGVQYVTYANTLHQKQISLQTYVNWRLGTKTTIMATITPSYMNVHAQNLKNHGWKLNLFGGVQQKLPWNLNLGANIFASTPDVKLQSRGPSQFMHMLSLSRAFLKEDRLNVTVMALNPFYGKMNVNMLQSGPGFTSLTTGSINLRMVQVSVSIRLGSLKSSVAQREALDTDAVDSSSGGGVHAPSVGM